MKGLSLIAGPCVIESMACLRETAETLIAITSKLGINYCFKASFDKANRTSIDSYRGPGIEEGLKMLWEIKQIYKVPIATDIHEAWQAEKVADVADIIQIPAFLCRQTDLLAAAAATGKIVNVKKAQFMAPWDMEHVVHKLKKLGTKQILICERGTCFGYNNLVVDMTSILELKKLGCPVFFDATHSVQRPGGNGSKTGGRREYAEPLAKAAIVMGSDGIFMEIHPDPDNAESDGPNMLKLSDADKVLSKIARLYQLREEYI